MSLFVSWSCKVLVYCTCITRRECDLTTRRTHIAFFWCSLVLKKFRFLIGIQIARCSCHMTCIFCSFLFWRKIISWLREMMMPILEKQCRQSLKTHSSERLFFSFKFYNDMLLEMHAWHLQFSLVLHFVSVLQSENVTQKVILSRHDNQQYLLPHPLSLFSMPFETNLN